MGLDAQRIALIRDERRATSDERLASVIEYVVAGMAESGDPHRGVVKLNKIIWWADQEAFRRFGYSVTGSAYQRLQQGPVPYRFPPVRESLVASSKVVITKQDVGAPKPATVLELGPRSQLAEVHRLLSSDDISMLDESLAKFHGWTGKQASDFSHQESIGWQNADDGDLIPDSAWLIDGDAPTAGFDVAQLLIDNGIAS